MTQKSQKLSVIIKHKEKVGWMSFFLMDGQRSMIESLKKKLKIYYHCRQLSQTSGNDGLKFAIYLDYSVVHPKIDDLKAVELVFLPPNTTPKTQFQKSQESSILLGVNEQGNTLKDLSTKELDDTINKLCKRFVFLDIDKELPMWGGKHNDTDILTEIGWCT